MVTLTERTIMKSRSGTYADTSENRRKHRVGQKYGAEKQPEDDEKTEKKEADPEKELEAVNKVIAAINEGKLNLPAAEVMKLSEKKQKLEAAKKQAEKINSGVKANEEKKNAKEAKETNKKIDEASKQKKYGDMNVEEAKKELLGKDLTVTDIETGKTRTEKITSILEGNVRGHETVMARVEGGGTYPIKQINTGKEWKAWKLSLASETKEPEKKEEPKKGATKPEEKSEGKQYASMDIKEAKKELVGKKITIKEYFFDGIDSYKDAEGEIKKVRLYGKEKQQIAEIDFPNGDGITISLEQLDKRKAMKYEIEFNDSKSEEPKQEASGQASEAQKKESEKKDKPEVKETTKKANESHKKTENRGELTNEEKANVTPFGNPELYIQLSKNSEEKKKFIELLKEVGTVEKEETVQTGISGTYKVGNEYFQISGTNVTTGLKKKKGDSQYLGMSGHKRWYGGGKFFEKTDKSEEFSVFDDEKMSALTKKLTKKSSKEPEKKEEPKNKEKSEQKPDKIKKPDHSKLALEQLHKEINELGHILSGRIKDGRRTEDVEKRISDMLKYAPDKVLESTLEAFKKNVNPNPTAKIAAKLTEMEINRRKTEGSTNQTEKKEETPKEEPKSEPKQSEAEESYSRIKFDDVPNSGKINLKKYLSEKVRKGVDEKWSSIKKIPTENLKKMEKGLVNDLNKNFEAIKKSQRAELLYSIMKVKGELASRGKETQKKE